MLYSPFGTQFYILIVFTVDVKKKSQVNLGKIQYLKWGGPHVVLCLGNFLHEQ